MFARCRKSYDDGQADKARFRSRAHNPSPRACLAHTFDRPTFSTVSTSMFKNSPPDGREDKTRAKLGRKAVVEIGCQRSVMRSNVSARADEAMQGRSAPTVA